MNTIENVFLVKKIGSIPQEEDKWDHINSKRIQTIVFPTSISNGDHYYYYVTVIKAMNEWIAFLVFFKPKLTMQ